MAEDELDDDPTLGELARSLSETRIDTLWVMGRDRYSCWITDYDEDTPISGFEIEQLAADLEQV
jgi:hypothetical protein